MKAHSQKSTVKEMTRMFKWYIFKYSIQTKATVKVKLFSRMDLESEPTIHSYEGRNLDSKT